MPVHSSMSAPISRMGAAELGTNPDHVLFGFVVIRLRAFRPLFRVPQVGKLRAAIFIQGAGDNNIAVRINTHILQMGIGQESFLSTDDSDGFLRANNLLNKRHLQQARHKYRYVHIAGDVF